MHCCFVSNHQSCSQPESSPFALCLALGEASADPLPRIQACGQPGHLVQFRPLVERDGRGRSCAWASSGPQLSRDLLASLHGPPCIVLSTIC